MQPSEPVFGTALDGFPHEQVVRAQVLKCIVGRSKFIDGLAVVVKKYGSGHRPTLQACYCDESMAALKHVLGDILEKTERLRRKSMPAASEAVQRVKGLNGFKCVAKI